jgi:colicin import membrane protein
MVVGGGSPDATGKPAPATPVPEPQPLPPIEPVLPPPVLPPPVVEQTALAQSDPEPVKVSKPEKVEPKVVRKPPAKNAVDLSANKKKDQPQNEEPAGKSKPETWKPSFTLAKRNRANARKEAEAKARAEQTARAQAAARAFHARVQQSIRALGAGFAPGTSIDVPGAGGALFGNYKLIVEAMYQQAWITPQEVNAESAVCRAKVVIRRDGTVIESRIIKSSGIRAMDKSVERALELKFIAPFPEESKDMQRLFYINFDLKTKRLLG